MMKMWKKNGSGVAVLFLIVVVMIPAFVLGGCRKNSGEGMSGNSSKGNPLKQNLSEDGKVEETAAAEPLAKDALPSFTEDEVKFVKVEREGKVCYTVGFEPKEDRDPYLFWDMKVPYESYVIVDTEAMFGMFKTFAGIDWEKAEVVSDNTKNEGKDNVDTGLDENASKITLDYGKENLTEVVVLVGNETKDGKYYCALESNPEKVFLIETFQIDSVLNRKPYDLILKIPYLVDIRTVKKVELEAGKKKVTMSRKDGTYKINGKKVAEDEYGELYQAILQPTITGEIEEEERASLDGEELLTLYFHRNLDGAKDYDVKIFAYDGVKDYVSVNGNTFFFVEKDEVDQILTKINNIS